MIAMDDEEWREEDIKEFTKLVENSENPGNLLVRN
jgi:hypothetical protein